MASEMVERVANTLLDAPLDSDPIEPDTLRGMLESYFASQIDGSVDQAFKDVVFKCTVVAVRAAIEVMRELPEEPGPRYSSGEYSRRNVEAMIDDALA